jgi:hypothetical protein
MVQKQGGVFGAVADSHALIKALEKFSSSGSSSSKAAGIPASFTAQQNGLELPAAVPASVPASGGVSCKTVEVSAKPYAYSLPVGKAALVMIDFQKDFLCEGGFGAALGNDLSQLQVGAWCQVSLVVCVLHVCCWAVLRLMLVWAMTSASCS